LSFEILIFYSTYFINRHELSLSPGDLIFKTDKKAEKRNKVLFKLFKFDINYCCINQLVVFLLCFNHQ